MTGTEAAPRPRRERLVGVQYLRGIAALQVVLFHCSAMAGHQISLLGFGVPLFFVISGFIMVVITNSESTRPWTFFRSRVTRVVPLYWLATTATVAAILLVGGSVNLRHLAASVAFLPYSTPGTDEHFFPVLGVGWTLNYEMLFYTLLALSLFMPRPFRIPFLSTAMLSLAITGFLVRPDGAILAFWTEPIILQFLAGAWLGIWWSGERPRFLWPLLSCAVAFWLTIEPGFYHFRVALWGGIGAVLMLLAILYLERRGVFSKPFTPLHLLGDASYSLYLWHVPMLIVLIPALRMMGFASFWILLLLTMSASIVAGLLSYRIVERPLLRLFHMKLYRGGVRVPAGP